ncbi:MAG: hypothetical protein IJW45_06680 [Oscillospiraceae bacterium]|nr:hypothetical protein [Oscillospiraceae bacterium]
MKLKILSTALAFLALICSMSTVVRATVIDGGFLVIDSETHRLVTELLELRGDLEPDFEENLEKINQIDLQLESLGVEVLEDDEYNELVGGNATPLVVPASQQYVKHFSERVITVWNGERYEIQIVTSVPEQKNSALRPSAGFYVKTEEQRAADNIDLLTVTATGLIGAVASGPFSTVQSVVTTGFTLYDMYKSWSEAVTPTTVIDGLDNSGLISFAIHEKHMFVKEEGAVDDGNQILGCVSNRVSYTAGLLYEGEGSNGGISKDDIDSMIITGRYYSQYFGTVDENGDGDVESHADYDSMIQRVAKVFWEYRHYGTWDFKVHHRIEKLVFSWAGGNTVVFEVPYNGLSW